MNDHLAARVREGEPRAVARALSIAVDDPVSASKLITELYGDTGRALVVGITGPPGAGKSTLVDRLIGELRGDGRRVGVLAVDPTSPFTGGAILGDRVRMQTHAADDGVFIRSLATRGHLGGLASATADAVAILDAAGCDVVLVETVGVGQDEVDIAALADVCVVVLVPDSGDEVQSLKAGIMEVADVFVVNKSDREGADRTAASIEAAIGFGAAPADGWTPPVVRTVATVGTGVREVLQAIERFRDAAGGRVAARRDLRIASHVGQIVQAAVAARLGSLGFPAAVAAVAARRLDPHRAAAGLLVRLFGGNDAGASDGVQVTIDHVGVATQDPGPLLAFLERACGASAGPAEEVASQQVRVRFVNLGGPAIELVEPLSAASPVATFLARRGPGLHHVALRVADLTATLERLRAAGVRLIDEAPRAGAHGTSVAFVHPSVTGGVLVELVAGGR